MSKLAAAIIAALSIGAIGGAVAVHQHHGAAYSESESALSSLTESYQKLQRELRDAETMSEQLRQRNLRMEDRLHDMQTRLMEVQEQLAQTTGDWEALDLEAFDIGMTDDPEVEVDRERGGRRDAALSDDEEAPRRRGREPADRAEREARREEFIEQFRERVQASLDEVILASDDPAEQERMSLMGEYSDYLNDLRRQMAEVEDEEARRELFREMAEAGAALRDIMQEQQDHVLREVAKQHGISDAGEQEAFVRSLREAQGSTAYLGPLGAFGGMMGGRGGGPGGGFGMPRGGPAPGGSEGGGGGWTGRGGGWTGRGGGR